MGRSTKKPSATTTTETAPVAGGAVAKTATVVAAPTSALANAFAQSAAFFKKKESYAPAVVDEPVVEAKPKKESTKKATYVPTETEIETQAKLEKKQRKKDKRKARIAEEKAKKAEATESAAKDESTESTETADAEEVEPVGENSTVDAATKSDRTVFVGNVSLDATQSAVKQFFSSCGKVETVRLRFLPVAGTAVNDHGNQKLVAKVCANKKIFTDKRDFCHAYVTFANQASVAKALKLNHASFMEKTIRVDHENPVVDPHRSVFVGNLSFHVTDEAVWTFFDKQLKTEEEPHPVENVRVIRDRETGAGKGFGYVLLKGRALAAKALSLHGKKIQNREIRVQVCGKRTKNKKGEDTHAKHEGRRASAGAASRISKKRAARGEIATPPPAKKAKVAKDKSAGGKPVVATKATAGDKNKPAKAAPGAVGKAKKFAKDGKNGRKPTTVKGKSGKKVARGPKTPFVKVKKPKHAARKARQAAEAAALAAKSS